MSDLRVVLFMLLMLRIPTFLLSCVIEIFVWLSSLHQRETTASSFGGMWMNLDFGDSGIGD